MIPNDTKMGEMEKRGMGDLQHNMLLYMRGWTANQRYRRQIPVDAAQQCLLAPLELRFQAQ
jgi:hypothetical protein